LKQAVNSAMQCISMHAMPPPPPPPPQAGSAPIAQDVKLLRNTRELAHVDAPQSAMQPMSNEGIPPPPPKLKQPRRHVSAAPQLWSMHAPQSTAQFEHVSDSVISQTWLPQNAHEPQSTEQLAQVSVVRLQRPSPQPGHRMQSPGQVLQFSPAAASQT
jgi:hypothetical protein